jgi:AraC family transcriptional regulator
VIDPSSEVLTQASYVARLAMAFSDAKYGSEEVPNPGQIGIQPFGSDESAAPSSGIVISRWTNRQRGARSASFKTPALCHVIGIALEATRLKVSADGAPVFDGIMSTGSVYISPPCRQIDVEFFTPYDFLQIRVENTFLESEGLLSKGTECRRSAVFRDDLSAALGRSLLKPGIDGRLDDCPRLYLEGVGRTLVSRAFNQSRRERRRLSVLPKWRIGKLERHIAEHISRLISLEEMATVVGLSKMHFAAQFRAATGLRPHEYLLSQRIEHAKCALSRSKMPIAEIALSVGFQTQAHFATVFKRFTGEPPAQWRHNLELTDD